ncbi:unnamed protein product [Cuscuta campestris]|uniref:Retrotransposon gag domain-containing protein n=1 Tax=Cuscuta campestris TaxID=132261 RepID=A0A484N3D5_9ASTE|nr:unnamed protein product [Cuscuta campestris]
MNNETILEAARAKRWMDASWRNRKSVKNLSVPDASRPELAFQLLRKGAYEWWKRADEKAPKPWTWEHFDWAFKKEYIPARYREEKRTEFMELKQGDMTLPELRQKFDHLAQFATTLVATPADRIEEFRKRLRPNIRPYVSILTTTDFSKAYDLMAKAEKDVDDYKASLKAEEGGPNTRPTKTQKQSYGKKEEHRRSFFFINSPIAPDEGGTDFVGALLEKLSARKPLLLCADSSIAEAAHRHQPLVRLLIYFSSSSINRGNRNDE